MNQEFIWELIFYVFVTSFLLLSGSGKFHYVFRVFLKSIRCVYQKLVLKTVDDESDLRRRYVVVDYNILIL